MKSFESERPLSESLKNVLTRNYGVRGKYLAIKLERGLPAISLSAHGALSTAVANDVDADLVFAQQVCVYGNVNDVLSP
jgi:D-sedoheptulose 7-phosphate isomerase